MASDAEKFFLPCGLPLRASPTTMRNTSLNPNACGVFDFAWPKRKVAVEIEGINYDGTRHQRVGGFLADCEKVRGGTCYRVGGFTAFLPRGFGTASAKIWRPQGDDHF